MEYLGLCAKFKVDNTPDQQNYIRHCHESNEIFLLLSGKCGFIVNDRHYSLSKGCILTIPHDVKHCLETGETPISFLSTQFMPWVLGEEKDNLSVELALELFEKKDDPIYMYRLEDKSFAFIRESLKRLCDLKGDNLCRDYFVYMNPVFLEITCNGEAQEGHAAQYTCGNARMSALTDEIIAYINENLSHINNLNDIRKKFYYSITYINRLFQNAVNTSVWQYVIMKKLDTACDLIMNGKSVQNAADACGFGDYSGFYRLFRKYYGISPSQLKYCTQKPKMIG